MSPTSQKHSGCLQNFGYSIKLLIRSIPEIESYHTIDECEHNQFNIFFMIFNGLNWSYLIRVLLGRLLFAVDGTTTEGNVSVVTF